ncbi:hypothetical protein LCL98_04930 [Rossellomorea aquimaris]|nr:hypothetical protein [Rossellomorea aquimaris]
MWCMPRHVKALTCRGIGYWFLDEGLSKWNPPRDLVDFIEGGICLFMQVSEVFMMSGWMNRRSWS